jgi:hypothetical protein
MLKPNSFDIDFMRDDLELARQLSPKLYRQLLAFRAIPHYARLIRIFDVSLAALLFILSVATANLQFAIEAGVLLIPLTFPAFIRSLAFGLYHALNIATFIGQRLRQLIHHSSRNH